MGISMGISEYLWEYVVNYGIWDLVGGAITILKNMSSSPGRMTSHI
jgi:hypothetical protein